MKNLSKILTKEFLKQKYLVEKLSTYKIAKAVGCGSGAVFRYLKKHNILRRTISEANKGKKYGSFSEEHKRKMSLNHADFSGKNHPNWNGGRCKERLGYVLIYSPNHPYKNNHGYVREHRLVVEKYLGRYLKPKEVVHHINGIKDDNRVGNLMGFASNPAHKRFHKNPNSVNSNEIVFDGRKI